MPICWVDARGSASWALENMQMLRKCRGKCKIGSAYIRLKRANLKVNIYMKEKPLIKLKPCKI